MDKHRVFYERVSNNIKIMENNLSDCSKTYDLDVVYGEYLAILECEDLEKARELGKNLNNTNVIFTKTL